MELVSEIKQYKHRIDSDFVEGIYFTNNEEFGCNERDLAYFCEGNDLRNKGIIETSYSVSINITGELDGLCEITLYSGHEKTNYIYKFLIAYGFMCLRVVIKRNLFIWSMQERAFNSLYFKLIERQGVIIWNKI